MPSERDDVIGLCLVGLVALLAASTSSRPRRTSSRSSSSGSRRAHLRARRARLHARLRHPRADQLRPRRRVHARRDDGRDRARATCFGLERHRVRPCVWLPVVLVTLVVSWRSAASLNASIEFVAYRPLRGAPRLAPLITAIGMSFILQNVALAWKGPNYVAVAARSCPTGNVFSDRRRRLPVEQVHRRARHRPRAAPARLARAAHAAGQGDARDRPGPRTPPR